MLNSIRISPLSIAVSYFILASLWILLSDRAIEYFVESAEVLSTLQSIKGIFFVTVTSGILFIFVNRLNSEIQGREQKQRQLREEFEKLFRKNPNPMWVYDIHSLALLEVNDAAIRKYGYSREEFLKLTIKDIRPANEVEKLEKQVQNIGDEPTKSKGWIHLTKDGQALRVEVTGYPVEYQGNKAELVMVNDITDQEKAEKKLQEAYAELNYHINNTPLGVIQWDENFRVIRWSEKAEQILGWKEEEVLGFHPNEWDFVYEEDKQEVDSVIESLIKGGGSGWFSRNRNYRKDKSVKHCEWFNSRLVDDSGNLLSVLSLVHDVTEVKKVEQQREQYQTRFEFAADLASDLIWEHDLSTDKFWFSRAMGEVFGHEQLQGTIDLTDLIQFIPEEDRNRCLKTYEDYLKHQQGIWEETYPLQKGDGSWAYVIDRGKIQFNKKGQPYRLVGVTIDITDRVEKERQMKAWNKQLEREVKLRTRELETVNKELESFSYSVSHDLRAPLRSVDGFSRALKSRIGKGDSDANEYINRIINASTRMRGLIDDLLNLSRITRKEIKKEKINLSEIVIKKLKELKEAHPDRNVTLYCDDDIIIHGDSNMVEVMMQNLIENAWKFTRNNEYATINLQAATNEESMVISISDNGDGFDQEYADKMFWPFQRLHSNTDFEGSGIGLATVQRIVSRHSGIISAYGEKGKGARIEISWPIR